MYGRGAQKYAPRNWEKGYDWSLSYSALQRHLNAFWGGEDLIQQNEAGDDPTAGVPHLTAAAWHTFALLDWSQTHPELDDRPVAANPHLVLGHRCTAEEYQSLCKLNGVELYEVARARGWIK